MTRRPLVAGDGDPRHGSLYGYGALACRCGLCREAHRVYKQEHAPKWSELDAPVLDPEVAGLAAKFMAGDVDKRENRGQRYVYDGKKDAVGPDGKRMRSRRHRQGSGVFKKDAFRGTKP